ncbi:MAG: 2OG-Fe(II) oxygenase [Leptolyngbyaceae bacterium]|nr:2OG-Fe(II) oxygenase [Leptolyngbyaceae bacterium]
MSQQTLQYQATTLGNEIFLLKNVIDAQTCQHLIRIAETADFQNAGILMETIDNSVRSNDLVQLGGANELSQSTNQLILGKLPVVKQFLFDQYGVRFPYAEPCSILRYRTHQFYKRHVDNILLSSRFQEVQQGIPTRDISVVGYLNDDFQGGETYFDRQDVKVSPYAGAVLLFPSYFTHPHQSLPILSGTKYAFTSWLFH